MGSTNRTHRARVGAILATGALLSLAVTPALASTDVNSLATVRIHALFAAELVGAGPDEIDEINQLDEGDQNNVDDGAQTNVDDAQQGQSGEQGNVESGPGETGTSGDQGKVGESVENDSQADNGQSGDQGDHQDSTGQGGDQGDSQNGESNG